MSSLRLKQSKTGCLIIILFARTFPRPLSKKNTVQLDQGEKIDYIPITGLIDINSPLARQRREAINHMIVQHTAGNMALSGVDLTEGDKARILYLCEHSDEMDAMLEELIRKHKEE